MLRSTEKGSAALGQVPGRSEDDVVNTVKLDAVGGMMPDCGLCCSLGHCQLVLDGVEHGFFSETELIKENRIKTSIILE